MRVGFEALDVDVSSDERDAVCRTVKERSSSSMFSGVQDLRLRLRQVKGALLCVAIVGFAEGKLVTSTATSSSPLGAVVEALDGLPQRLDRMPRIERPRNAVVTALDGLLQRLDRMPRIERPRNAVATARHAALREEVKRLLA